MKLHLSINTHLNSVYIFSELCSRWILSYYNVSLASLLSSPHFIVISVVNSLAYVPLRSHLWRFPLPQSNHPCFLVSTFPKPSYLICVVRELQAHHWWGTFSWRINKKRPNMRADTSIKVPLIIDLKITLSSSSDEGRRRVKYLFQAVRGKTPHTGSI